MRDWKAYQRKVLHAFKAEGKKASLVKMSSGAYNVTTGKKSKDIELTDTVYMLFKVTKDEHEKMIPVEQIELMCSYSKKIDPTDTENVKLRFDYKYHDIVEARPVRPGGIVLFYKMKIIGLQWDTFLHIRLTIRQGESLVKIQR